MKTLTEEELAKVRLGELKDLRGCDLRGANLTDANLTDANLTDACLTDANLTDANLTDANLTDACLTDANLTGAYLTGANLAGAYLAGANLAGAYLMDANLAGANLAGANLAGANLAGANLAGANLAGANLAGANLARANLTRVDLAAFKVAPEAGGFVAFKGVTSPAGNAVLAVEVDAEAARVNGIGSRKIRVDRCRVIGVVAGVRADDYCGTHYPGITYRVGEEVSTELDDDVRIECTKGIHLFMTASEAAKWARVDLTSGGGDD